MTATEQDSTPGRVRRFAAWARAVGRPTFAPTRRDAVALQLGLLVFWFVWNGPPVAELFGVDLRFGLTGPPVTFVWHPLGAALLVAVVLFVERRRLASLLLVRPNGLDFEIAGFAFAGALVGQLLVGITEEQQSDAGIGMIVGLGVAQVIGMIVVAAVTEEVVYRGYLAERLGSLLRSRWAGAAVSFAVFVGPHIAFFGWQWLLGPAIGAVVIAATALVRRSLPGAMLVHAAVNLPLLIPTVMRAVG